MVNHLNRRLFNLTFSAARLEVWYCDGYAWYEYRVWSTDDRLLFASDNGYGSPEYALRDGLALLISMQDETAGSK